MEVRRLTGAIVASIVGAFSITGCQTVPPPEDDLERLGEDIFFNETFAGNGRTCGTCHRAEENFALSPAFIATLPADDPLFVAETNPNLADNFENPELMRKFALILENQDGFGDLPNNFNMRGIPHTLALPTSIASADGPRTGWSGDGAPGDGTLRSFAVGAVIQHFTLSTNRIADVDFRLPTETELDALETFQLSLGRQEELDLPLALTGDVARRGQEIFLDNGLGKCNACHFNAGANGDPVIFGDAGNLNFNTGVEDLPDQPADLTGQMNPPDDGFGNPGIGEFNTPTLIEAADTGPFFHNNSVETIEGAVAFYNGESFNNSPAGQLLSGATGSGINLDATQVVEVAAFLRVINSLENIRESIDLIQRSENIRGSNRLRKIELLERASAETHDAIQVLVGGGLHPSAVKSLNQARLAIDTVLRRHTSGYIADALDALSAARDKLVGT
ncbi:MAG: hypothetical protein OER80_10385 [Gammaproteobacteria bacterium]|nr:hypothetical protein [Gammaproteobacteria bacterium]MDH3767103.1 hypothetical protein [Gammaproteobacteria bacterium]